MLGRFRYFHFCFAAADILYMSVPLKHITFFRLGFLTCFGHGVRMTKFKQFSLFSSSCEVTDVVSDTER